MHTYVLAILVAIFCIAVGLNTKASFLVWSDKMSSKSQRSVQLAFVWLVPLLGAVLALHVLKRVPITGAWADSDSGLSDLEVDESQAFSHLPAHFTEVSAQ